MAEVTLNVYALILLLTFLQALLFCAIIVERGVRQQSHSDFLLAFLILLIGLSVVPHLFGWLSIGVLWNNLTFYPWNGLELAVLPTMFLFLQSRLNSQWKINWKALKHYWLYLIYFIYHFAVAIQGKQFAKWWWFEVNNKYNIDALFNFTNVLLFTYHLFRFRKIYKSYQSYSSDRYSNLQMLSIDWIRNFIIAYFLFITVDISITIMEVTMGAQYDKMWWAYLTNLVLIYYISIYGLIKKPLDTLDFEMSKVTFDEREKLESNEKQLFSQNEIDQWRLTLKTHIEKEKSFLNPDLRLSELAQYHNVNISTLSSLINLSFNKNFNDLINSYRIETFIEKINEGQLKKYTLTSIAYDCGFNSKTTFNRAFKKHMGISPTDFLKKKE